MSNRQVKLAILSVLASFGKQHRYNVIGRAGLPGQVEHSLRLTFGPAQRQEADLAFGKLIEDGFIQATFDDTIDPAGWFVITDDGHRALTRRLLDDLDEALAKISSHLVEVRAGCVGCSHVWSARLSQAGRCWWLRTTTETSAVIAVDDSNDHRRL
jgi:hypothetical protein